MHDSTLYETVYINRLQSNSNTSTHIYYENRVSEWVCAVWMHLKTLWAASGGPNVKQAECLRVFRINLIHCIYFMRTEHSFTKFMKAPNLFIKVDVILVAITFPLRASAHAQHIHCPYFFCLRCSSFELKCACFLLLLFSAIPCNAFALTHLFLVGGFFFALTFSRTKRVFCRYWRLCFAFYLFKIT